MRDQRRPSGPSPAENELLARFRSGERTCFRALVRPHLAPLAALARRLTGDGHWAEDLVQETLLRACRGLDGFRGDASLRTWLLRIAARLAAEPERWKRREPALALGEFDVPDALGPDPGDDTLHRELRERLDESMERLPVRQRSALHLRAVEGLDYRAIAGVLDCTPAAARMLVLAARRKILERMGSYLEP